MLLAVGIWAGVLGYAGLAWGVQLWRGQPQSFAYLLGLSSDPGTPSSASSGELHGAVGTFVQGGEQIAKGGP